MNKNDLYRAFGDVDDDILERSEAPAVRRKAPALQRWGVLAACLVLAASLTGAAFAAEAREYSAAVEFFEDNGLSMEGLSRSDVKAVYRDITTEHFTYDKTAEVLERSVPGLEIPQREPTPEELAALWDRKVLGSGLPWTGYHVHTEEVPLGGTFQCNSWLERYEEGQLIWQSRKLRFRAEECFPIDSGGAAVWGGTPVCSSAQSSCGWLSRVDEAGNVLWEKSLYHGFQDEYIAAVLDNGDGTWAVVSRGDLQYLCLSQYDLDGNELSFRKTLVGNRGIWNAARLGDGYLVQLGHQIDGETARLAKLDHEGNLIDDFTYEGEDCDYYLTDMAEFGGRVYLSAYAVPKQTDEGGRHEIANILEYVFDKGNLDISSQELTPVVRENYTAVLLLCDPEGGAPETFYSVKGSLGGKLNANDAGELEWDVESVVNTFFSPATNSFTIGGACQVFRYAFDSSGNLLRQEDTGESVSFRK